MGQNNTTHTEEHTAAASAACSDEPILTTECKVQGPTHNMESDEQGQHTEEVTCSS